MNKRTRGGFSMRLLIALMALFYGAFTLVALSGCENYRMDKLIRDLEAKEAEVRMNAAIDLGAFKNPRAVPPLIAVLKDNDKYVPVRAEESLVAMGPVAVEPLIAALRNKNEPNRPAVARILGNIRDIRSIDPLKHAMDDPNPELMKEARSALLKVLPTALQDSQPDVRLKAAKILQEIPDPVAVAPLIGALNDKDGNVRKSAAIALGKIGPPAVKSLIGLLKAPTPGIRCLAAEQLGNIRDPEALEPLLSALRDHDPNVQWWAGWALGAMGETAEQSLKKLSHDPDLNVQRLAKEALNKINTGLFDP
ncbi:MAG: HEAT repeat domain-containing protein [Syntrophales bacterium]|nr:HEAT repeat domain-containing protein [Syntrophales bacterium]